MILSPNRLTRAATGGVIALGYAGLLCISAWGGPSSFDRGLAAYADWNLPEAARAFQEAARERPAPGTLVNLGLAEWHRGRVGHAIRAWEQAQWLDNFNAAARGNLAFARKQAQLESPDLRWYEVVSTWLPVNWWAWIAGFSLWGAVAMVVLPGILRARRATWQQAAAAFGLMVFLLSVPAHVGVHTRSRIGYVLRKDTPLRLTPTVASQVVTRLSPGEPARLERARGNYLLVRTSRGTGWVDRDLFGLVSADPGQSSRSQ